MARLVLDSDTITYILQGRPQVLARLAAAVEANVEIYLCPVVYFEVRRGLLHKQPKKRLREFDALAGRLVWGEVERPIWDAAARAWARVRSSGRPHDDDADLLIAAFTRHLRATLVTNNTSDFAHLGVALQNCFT